MNAIDLLTQQHRAAEHLFDRLGRLEPGDLLGRQELFARIADLVALHTALEEDHLYPRAEQFRKPDAQSEALGEHEQLKRELSDLLQMDPMDPAFSVKLASLRDALEEHMEEEETELFPALEQLLDEAELLELGIAMEADARERGTPPEGEVTPVHDPYVLN